MVVVRGKNLGLLKRESFEDCSLFICFIIDFLLQGSDDDDEIFCRVV